MNPFLYIPKRMVANNTKNRPGWSFPTDTNNTREETKFTFIRSDPTPPDPADAGPEEPHIDLLKRRSGRGDMQEVLPEIKSMSGYQDSDRPYMIRAQNKSTRIITKRVLEHDGPATRERSHAARRLHNLSAHINVEDEEHLMNRQKSFNAQSDTTQSVISRIER